MTWRDESTLRGRLEAAIDPVISGGATEDQIDRVVNKLLLMMESGGEPKKSANALKLAVMQQLPAKGENLPEAALKARLNNLWLIVSCDSWSVP